MTDDSKRRGFIALILFTAVVFGYFAYLQVSSIRWSITPAVVHSAENNSPYSILDGTTIRIKPFEASVEIPEAWLTPKPAPPNEHTKNIFVSWTDLNEVNRIDRVPNGFDSEDAEVINAVLPFQDCVAHVGDRSWGNGLWNDLQSRIYVTSLSVEEIISRLENDGLKVATTNFEGASLKAIKYANIHKEWNKHTFEILDAPTHFMLYKKFDFYFRSENDMTVAFVFVHAGMFETEIALLLNSFTWSK